MEWRQQEFGSWKRVRVRPCLLSAITISDAVTVFWRRCSVYTTASRITESAQAQTEEASVASKAASSVLQVVCCK